MECDDSSGGNTVLDLSFQSCHPFVCTIERSETLSIAEAKELLRLCKVGRLFEVQNWISFGNSLSVPAELRTSLLRVALDSGFYSLLELLVRNEHSQELKDQGLRYALSHKRLDRVELLVSHGAALTHSAVLL